MNLLKIACHNKSQAEVETADLSVEEFAELRRLMDLCGVMTARDDTESEAEADEEAITISVTTADGVHDHTFTGDTVNSELEELTDFIKYLGKIHQSGFSGPITQPRVSSMP